MFMFVCSGHRDQSMNRDLVPPKDLAQAPLIRDICDQPEKKYMHTYKYSVAINKKDKNNGRKKSPNFIVIW